MLGAAAGPVEPHVGLTCRGSARLLQHLQCRLVSMQHSFLAQLPVQRVIHWPQPVARGVQDPVGHGLPGQLQAFPLEFLLLAVQRCIHHKFLHHDMGQRFRGGKAALAEYRLSGRFQEISFSCFHFALFAGVGVVHIFLNPETGRLHLQAPAHLFSNLLHNHTADIADVLLFGKPVLHHFRGHTLRHDLQHTAALPLAGVGLYRHLLLWRPWSRMRRPPPYLTLTDMMAWHRWVDAFPAPAIFGLVNPPKASLILKHETNVFAC